MKLILARHGNTFNQGERVFWVGKQNDLPLAPSGITQAEQLGKALHAVPLTASFCAPLLRTKQFASTALTAAGSDLPVHEDERLTELDYGEWSGRTDEEIIQRFGSACLEGWTRHSVWPANCGWTSSEIEVTNEIASFVSELRRRYSADSKILIVSSNGRLRYFLKLLPGEFEKRASDQSLKVGTGRIGMLDIIGENIKLEFWNQIPEALTKAVVG